MRRTWLFVGTSSGEDMAGFHYAKLLAILGCCLTASTHAATVTYLYTDPQGTALAEADAAGNVVKLSDYRPFGSQTLGAPANGIGFTGHVEDVDTSLIYMQARYYDASTGRFLSVDPKAVQAGSAFSFNRFAYARNNVANYVDPDGQDALWINGSGGRSRLVIPVHFVGASASKENIAAIVRTAAHLEVLTRSVSIQIVPTSTPIQGVLNTLDLSNGKDFTSYPLAGEGVNALGGNNGHIDSSSPLWTRAAVHDSLHFAGLADGYKDTGKAGEARNAVIRDGYTKDDIMADRSGNNVSPQELEHAQSNPTTHQCQEGADGKTACS